ncbi:MAG: Cdc6/Cdc18 family protein [Candidatus Aenigmatarchaeota archaeon]
MALFDDMLGHGESLFKNPGVLEETYLPRLLPYRENKQKYLANSIKKVERGGANVLIHGPPGIGKTASVRYIFRELKMESDDILPVYINAWENNNFTKVVHHICNELEMKPMGRNTDRLWNIILDKIKDYKGIAFAFDEIDKTGKASFLYNFLEELDYKTIFLITTKKDWYSKVDDRIRSRLNPEYLEYETYSYEETEGILGKRKKHAFVQGVWEEGAFEEVVNKCHKKEDIRFGLSLLRRAGNKAEDDASKKITLDHVKSVLDNERKRDGKSLENFE